LLISSLLSSALPLLSTFLNFTGGFDIKTISYIYLFIGFVFSIIGAVAFAFIINAIWKDRD